MSPDLEEEAGLPQTPASSRLQTLGSALIGLTSSQPNALRPGKRRSVRLVWFVGLLRTGKDPRT
jgi:hypothetical protein